MSLTTVIISCASRRAEKSAFGEGGALKDKCLAKLCNAPSDRPENRAHWDRLDFYNAILCSDDRDERL